MAGKITSGNCFLCGSTISKAAFKKHILTKHSYDGEDGQECVIIKAEGAYDKAYWLYLDMPATSTLKTLDAFLRKIWLECCGHMSEFYSRDMGQIKMNTLVGFFREGVSLQYEYDFGSTTELLITVVGKIRRPKQRTAVRLLGRNEPIRYPCASCGAEATHICCECIWTDDSPFFCEACLEAHEHESALPVVNSPRMGVCGYCGELDAYEFDPNRFTKQK